MIFHANIPYIIIETISAIILSTVKVTVYYVNTEKTLFEYSVWTCFSIKILCLKSISPSKY